MRLFKNLKIKTKLISCFIMMAIITSIVGIVGVSNMYELNNRCESMYYNNFLPSQKLSEVVIALQNIRANQMAAIYEQNPETLQSKLDAIDQAAQQDNALLKEFEAKIQTEEERELYNTLISNLTTYRDVRNTNLELIKAQKYDEAIAKLPKVTEARITAEDSLQKLIDYNTGYIKNTLKDNTANFEKNSIIMIVIIIAGMALAVGLGLAIANIISKPLRMMVGAAKEIADGNLDVDIQIDTKDEVGALGQEFRRMTSHINEIMTNISSAAEQVAAGAKQVSDSSMDLSQGATEQASAIEQLTASMEEISSQTKLNAGNANEANELAELTKKNAIQGNNEMELMLNAMEEINQSSSNISKIIKVIDEIAFQTNILALNAAVEAARAGQHGKGFAVVAEEVRNLAARSANAAKETTGMIEGSIKKVNDGTKIATETAEALNQIVEDIAKVANIVADIAAASNEQASGIAQINQGIMQVSDVVQTNSATSEESAAASEELSSQAELLKEQVERFQLKRSNHSSEKLTSDVLKVLENMTNKKKSVAQYPKQNGYDEVAVSTMRPKNIVLSDSEFGKY